MSEPRQVGSGGESCVMCPRQRQGTNIVETLLSPVPAVLSICQTGKFASPPFDHSLTLHVSRSKVILEIF